MTSDGVDPSAAEPMPDRDDLPGEGDARWDPDGTDVAQSLLARATALGRSITGTESRRRNGKKGQRRRRSPGAGWSGPAGDDRDPQALDTALDRLVSEHGWGQELAVHGVIARWDHIVGADVAAHVRTEKYADGELTVRADSTAWATQVKLLAPDLVRRLNAEIGDGSVTRVKVLGPHAPSWRKGPRSVPGRGPRDTYG